MTHLLPQISATRGCMGAVMPRLPSDYGLLAKLLTSRLLQARGERRVRSRMGRTRGLRTSCAVAGSDQTKCGHEPRARASFRATSRCSWRSCPGSCRTRYAQESWPCLWLRRQTRRSSAALTRNRSTSRSPDGTAGQNCCCRPRRRFPRSVRTSRIVSNRHTVTPATSAAATPSPQSDSSSHRDPRSSPTNQTRMNAPST